jgi:hypothetical protein
MFLRKKLFRKNFGPFFLLEKLFSNFVKSKTLGAEKESDATSK